MLSYEQALNSILENTSPLGQTRIRLEKMRSHVLAQPIVAKLDLPTFDNSAVDGYGVRIADVEHASESNPIVLKLAGAIQAGQQGQPELDTHSAIKILTGAQVPSSCEAVVMLEYCQEQNGAVIVKRSALAGENIRRRGEEFARGQIVLPAGVRVTPPVVGLLASFGYPSFMVYEKPSVALVITGDELVKPGLPLKLGQIYNSNAYSLPAALNCLGVEEWSCFHARDSRTSTRQNLIQAIEQADIIITSGGVSVGDRDYVKEVLEDLGVITVFWKVAIKPGKPVYFGTYDHPKKEGKKLVFGLPGNPVAALLTFNQFVKPAIMKMMGRSLPDCITAVIKKELKKKPGKLDFVRARLQSEPDGTLSVNPTIGQGSHMLGGLAVADCLIYFAADNDLLPAGSTVSIALIDWLR